MSTTVRGKILSIIPRQGGLLEVEFGGPLPVAKKPSAREVADWLGIAVSTLKRGCKAGKIPHHYSRERGYHFNWHELLEWDKKDFVPVK